MARAASCMDYLQRHPEFKEGQQYVDKYAQLLSRAEALVKNQVKHRQKSVFSSVRTQAGVAKAGKEFTKGAVVVAFFSGNVALNLELSIAYQPIGF